MTSLTSGEQEYIQEMAQRLIRLRHFLNLLDLEHGVKVEEWFDRLAQIKAIQGNSNNDVSFTACLMAKAYLISEFGEIDGYDVSAKPQGAPGLDIDIQTKRGQRIIGEIKTTVPYSGARNDLGSQQKSSFQKDFTKLNNTPADFKYLFVTDSATYHILTKKYASQIHGVRIVQLFTENGEV